MYYYEVGLTLFVRGESSSFVYHSDLQLTSGSLVRVPIGKKETIGVVIKSTKKPNYDTRSILDQLPGTIPTQLISLMLWIEQYYNTHLSTVLQLLLPRGLTKQRRSRDVIHHSASRKKQDFQLTADQLRAVDVINTTKKTVLLHGITGSGKTAVYIESARRAMQQGKSAIILVPEIALTTQLIDEFSHYFSRFLLYHSQQTEAVRHNIWREVQQSTEPVVIVGARSALFLPVKNVGLIVIDEAHEPGYKQEQAPRYSALRAASVLAKLHNAPLVLGSATPLVQDYYTALETGSPIVSMAAPARSTAKKPNTTLVDNKHRNEFSHHRFLSNALISSIEESLSKNKQSLIFHNRRGTAATTLCDVCGWTAVDPITDLPLTLHADSYTLVNHVSGQSFPVPTVCPVCGNAQIIHKGIGTKLLETEITKLFPAARIARFDADTHKEETLHQIYSELYNGSVDIIIGTQIVAKGLDLPHLRTVGVVQADSGLVLPDFGASERVFQLLAQVVGRAGRSDAESEVVVQSYEPDHPAIRYGITQDYANFYKEEIAHRKKTAYPPFSFLLSISIIYKTEAAAIRNARMLSTMLRSQTGDAAQVLGPAPAFYERTAAGAYQWKLLVKSKQRKELLRLAKLVPASPHYRIDLDPASLL